MSTQRDDVAKLVEERRARFRGAVSRLATKAQSTELLRMLLLPGAFAVLAGFVLMFLGWYGAARTPRQIEQIPYLISGGFIGLGLVFIGGLVLASALWMSMLQRFSEKSDERADRRAREERVQDEATATPVSRRRGAQRRNRTRRP